MTANQLTQIKTNGQSLLEVVVAIGVIVFVLVGLISTVTFGLSNAQFARNKAQAIKYTQEAVEWLRIERDASWNNFYDHSSDSGTIYCLRNTSWPSPGVCSSAMVIDDGILSTYDIFHREATLTRSGIDNDKVLVTVKVWWYQGNRYTDVVVNTYLTKW